MGRSLVSGRRKVRMPDVMAITPKIRVGMMGLISARAATVVDRVPPTLKGQIEKELLRGSNL